MMMMLMKLDSARWYIIDGGRSRGKGSFLVIQPSKVTSASIRSGRPKGFSLWFEVQVGAEEPVHRRFRRLIIVSWVDNAKQREV